MNHNHQMAIGSPSATHVSWTRGVNITPIERFGRIVIGLTGVVGGFILLTNSPSVFVGTLEALLMLAGLDLIVTGATGRCPLYKMLGYTPKSLKGDNHEPQSSNDKACH